MSSRRLRRATFLLPDPGSEHSDSNNDAPGTWVEFDVTSAITGDGTYTFVLKGNTDAGGRFPAFV
jgi:hypothetical protein